MYNYMYNYMLHIVYVTYMYNYVCGTAAKDPAAQTSSCNFRRLLYEKASVQHLPLAVCVLRHAKAMDELLDGRLARLAKTGKAPGGGVEPITEVQTAWDTFMAEIKVPLITNHNTQRFRFFETVLRRVLHRAPLSAG